VGSVYIDSASAMRQ